MKTAEETAARLRTLTAEGLTLPLSEAAPDSPALITSFMYFGGGETWVLTDGTDPDEADIDHTAARVVGGRLLVDDAGSPVSLMAAQARGLKPRIRIPCI